MTDDAKDAARWRFLRDVAVMDARLIGPFAVTMTTLFAKLEPDVLDNPDRDAILRAALERSVDEAMARPLSDAPLYHMDPGGLA